MSCDETRPLLSDYLVGVLADDQQTGVEEHLIVCAACATELAGLVTLEDDLRALSEASPATAPSRSVGRWGGLAVAASLLLGLGLGIVAGSLTSGPAAPGQVDASPSLLHGALASARPGKALALGRTLTATQSSVIDLTGGSLIEAEAGARLELLTPRRVRQRAGAATYRVAPGESPFDVHMPHGTVRALGTIFKIEVQEVPMQKSAKAAAGVAVVIGVVSGVVLVTSNDPEQPEVRLAAGQRAIATAGSISLETGGVAPVGSVNPVAALRAKVAQQEERIATLEAEKAALAERLSATEDGGAPLTKPGLAKAGNAPVAFGRWGEIDELKDVDWKAKGVAARKLRGLLGKLLAALDAGERPSPELGIAIAKSNQVLAQLALAINGKLPTHATGNGEFTHPYVLGNLMAEHLAGSGAPLTQRQIARLQQLGEGYDTAWEVQQKTYDDQTFKVQKIVDEVLLKQKMMARFRADLDPAQREALVDPELTDLTQLDIFSPSQLLNGVARPLGVETTADLPDRLRKVAARELGVEPSELEPFAGVFTTWGRSFRLTAVPRSRAKFVPIADVARAGKAQIQALQELALRINASDETKAKVRSGTRIYVPRLLQPKQN